MDDRHAGVERVGRMGEADGPAVDLDLALVRHDDAGEDLPERALAGAVLAAERVAGARSDLERDVVERDDARKALGDVVDSHGLSRLETARRRSRATSLEARYFMFRYASGTSVKPQSRSWRAHVPRLSFVTRTRSIGMICGTSCLSCTLSKMRCTDT